jgi:hypothetical protein
MDDDDSVQVRSRDGFDDTSWSSGSSDVRSSSQLLADDDDRHVRLRCGRLPSRRRRPALTAQCRSGTIGDARDWRDVRSRFTFELPPP